MSHESDKATFVCPMHPEIQASKAGSCSKCGMALQPQSHDAKPHVPAPAPEPYTPVNV